MSRAWLVALAALGCRAAPLAEPDRYPAGSGLEARYVAARGTRIRYVETGHGPPVVLLHGLGASIYSWRAMVHPLARAGFRVVAFDNRGFGFSERPAGGYANQEYVRLLDAVLDSLGVDQATLVGHSMGGQVAAEFALARPGRVRGLALLAPSGFGVRLPWVLDVVRWPLVGPLLAGLRGRWATGRMLRSAYGDPGQVTANDVDQYYAAVGQADYGRALRGVLRSYDFDALRGRLDAIRTPTLIIWGGADRWIPPAVGRHLAAGLSRVAFVMLPQAGHALPDEAPERATELLLGFLERGVPQVPGDLATGTRVDGPDLQGNIINHSVENE